MSIPALNNNLTFYSKIVKQGNIFLQGGFLHVEASLDPISGVSFWREIKEWLENNKDWKALSLGEETISREELLEYEQLCLPLKPSNLLSLKKISAKDIQNLQDKRVPPLHKAAYLGCLDLVQWALDQGGDVNVKIEGGSWNKYSPLLIAFINDHLEVCELLLRNNANKERTLFSCNNLLEFAYKKGREPSAKFLIQRGLCEYMMEGDALGRGPLHYAVTWKKINFIRFLIKCGANVNLSSDKKTPLFLAIDYQCAEAAELLVQAGARVSTSLLKLAISLKSHAIVEHLLKTELDLDEIDKNGVPLFHYALIEGDEKIVKLLLSKGVKVNAKDKRGISSLHLATFRGSENLVELLLAHRAEVNSKTPTDITPLHLAAYRGFLGIVGTLLDNGAEIDAIDYSDSTPFDLALINAKNLLIINYLLERKANPLISPKTLYSSIKTGRFKNFKNLAKQVPISARVIAREEILRKYCAHVYGVGGASSLLGKDGLTNKSTLPLDGLNSPYEFMKYVVKITHRLAKNHPALMPGPYADVISSMCAFSSRFWQKTSKDYVERIKSKQPTLLQGEEWNHSTELLFYGDLLMLCNERIFHDSNIFPVRAFRFNRDKLTEETLERLLNSKKDSRGTWEKGINEFKMALECTSDVNEQAIEVRCIKLFQDTKVGNCSWKSIEIAIHAYLEGVHQQRQVFDPWLLYTQLWFLKKYLNFHTSQKSPYYPDLDLIEKMFDRVQKACLPEHPFYNEYLAIEKKKESLISSLPSLNARAELPTEMSQEKIASCRSEDKEPTTYWSICKIYLP